ncbi:C-type lectin domain family 4 member E-like [Megalops cyprinoides]|uniref:C-type lectin domain family 4 member E-like n=1 Tax=Megalops cyprinoides TaxID=118141 RepID=UPI001864CED2|nr:C-type lectin domain family 4 member E-like [Megalops cyprinoides]
MMENRLTEYKKSFEELPKCVSDLLETSSILEAFRVSEDCMTCRYGWKRFNGKCYFFSSDRLNWSQSRDDCVTKGGHLAIIDSTEEQTFLDNTANSKMEHASDNFWIGITDSETEDQWVWVDNTPLDNNKKFWVRGEPDDWKGRHGELKFGEDCARTGIYGCAVSCWGDSNCSAQRRRICEAKGV